MSSPSENRHVILRDPAILRDPTAPEKKRVVLTARGWSAFDAIGAEGKHPSESASGGQQGSRLFMLPPPPPPARPQRAQSRQVTTQPEETHSPDGGMQRTGRRSSSAHRTGGPTRRNKQVRNQKRPNGTGVVEAGPAASEPRSRSPAHASVSSDSARKLRSRSSKRENAAESQPSLAHGDADFDRISEASPSASSMAAGPYLMPRPQRYCPQPHPQDQRDASPALSVGPLQRNARYEAMSPSCTVEFRPSRSASPNNPGVATLQTPIQMLAKRRKLIWDAGEALRKITEQKVRVRQQTPPPPPPASAASATRTPPSAPPPPRLSGVSSSVEGYSATEAQELRKKIHHLKTGKWTKDWEDFEYWDADRRAYVGSEWDDTLGKMGWWRYLWHDDKGWKKTHQLAAHLAQVLKELETRQAVPIRSSSLEENLKVLEMRSRRFAAQAACALVEKVQAKPEESDKHIERAALEAVETPCGDWMESAVDKTPGEYSLDVAEVEYDKEPSPAGEAKESTMPPSPPPASTTACTSLSIPAQPPLPPPPARATAFAAQVALRQEHFGSGNAAAVGSHSAGRLMPPPPPPTRQMKQRKKQRFEEENHRANKAKVEAKEDDKVEAPPFPTQTVPPATRPKAQPQPRLPPPARAAAIEKRVLPTPPPAPRAASPIKALPGSPGGSSACWSPEQLAESLRSNAPLGALPKSASAASHSVPTPPPPPRTAATDHDWQPHSHAMVEPTLASPSSSPALASPRPEPRDASDLIPSIFSPPSPDSARTASPDRSPSRSMTRTPLSEQAREDSREPIPRKNVKVQQMETDRATSPDPMADFHAERFQPHKTRMPPPPPPPPKRKVEPPPPPMKAEPPPPPMKVEPPPPPMKVEPPPPPMKVEPSPPPKRLRSNPYSPSRAGSPDYGLRARRSPPNNNEVHGPDTPWCDASAYSSSASVSPSPTRRPPPPQPDLMHKAPPQPDSPLSSASEIAGRDPRGSPRSSSSMSSQRCKDAIAATEQADTFAGLRTPSPQWDEDGRRIIRSEELQPPPLPPPRYTPHALGLPQGLPATRVTPQQDSVRPPASGAATAPACRPPPPPPPAPPRPAQLPGGAHRQPDGPAPAQVRIALEASSTRAKAVPAWREPKQEEALGRMGSDPR